VPGYRIFCRVASSTLAPSSFASVHRFLVSIPFDTGLSCGQGNAPDSWRTQRANRRLLLAFAPGELGSLNGILPISVARFRIVTMRFEIASAVFKLNFD
jgi:hypothetical protein